MLVLEKVDEPDPPEKIKTYIYISKNK